MISSLVIATALVSFENVTDGMASVRLKGFLGERLDAMVERHVAACDVDYITDVFAYATERGNRWQTEFWGKWMHSSAPYLGYVADEKLRMENGKCRIADELRIKIERGIDRILDSQEECGYIGNYPDELRCGEGWDVWGMKYTMMGLLHYYDLILNEVKVKGEGDGERAQRALDAAKRLCDYVIAEIGPNGRRGRKLWQTGNWSGYASSSILEPVVWLYKRTNEKKYFDFATYIVKGMTEPEAGPRLVDLALKGVSVADRNGYGNVPETHGGYVMKHNRWKAYEMMSCYQGLLEYCEIVELCKYENTQYPIPPVEDILKAAIMTAEDIVATEVNLAGGCSSCEAWFHGADKQHRAYAKLQETCVTITWMRLCEKLLRMTDDPKWADHIERAFYNAYLAALRYDGREFAAYTPLSGYRWHGMHHCAMHTDCCTANGPRGFLCFLKNLCRRDGNTVTFNFYASANMPGFEMYSLYPRTGDVRIVCREKGRKVVRFRVPAWSGKPQVAVNGKACEGIKPGCYAVVDREWRVGDVITLSFDLDTIAHVKNDYIAFTRGPILLARDSRLDRSDIGEAFRRGISDGDRLPGLTPVRVPSDKIWMAFSAVVPIGSHYENPEGRNSAAITFCDYASAGNEWSPDNHYRTWFPVERSPYDDLAETAKTRIEK